MKFKPTEQACYAAPVLVRPYRVLGIREFRVYSISRAGI